LPLDQIRTYDPWVWYNTIKNTQEVNHVQSKERRSTSAWARNTITVLLAYRDHGSSSAVRPPSKKSSVPVMNDASSLARKAAA